MIGIVLVWIVICRNIFKWGRYNQCDIHSYLSGYHGIGMYVIHMPYIVYIVDGHDDIDISIFHDYDSNFYYNHNHIKFLYNSLR
jgi:hypothetical protein